MSKDEETKSELEDQFPANKKPKTDYAKKRDKRHDKSDEPREKFEKVTSGNVVKRKRGWWHKVGEWVTGEDGRSVGGYVIHDILIPALKDLVVDAVSNGTSRAIYGEARSRNRNGRRTDYAGAYRRGGDDDRRHHRSDERERPQARRSKSRSSEEFVLETRQEAEEVVDKLLYIAQSYGAATMSDFYDLIGETGSYTDDKWGWDETAIADASIERVRGGYVCVMDRPEFLE